MPMPRNNPGDVIRSAEWNELADQIDVNTVDIADVVSDVADINGVFNAGTVGQSLKKVSAGAGTNTVGWQAPGEIDLRGSVATSAALPSSGQSIGWGYVAADTGHVWLYTGASGGGAINGFIDLGPVAVSVLPLPLYTVTGHGAVLPPGETIVTNYADLAAFEAAIHPTAQGEQIQLAYANQVRLLVGKYIGNSWRWVEIGMGA